MVKTSVAMPAIVHIPKTLPPQVSMQFSTLLQDGMTACQRLGGDLWTDYNEHDPGVTILEQLCYAITDLGSRIAYPVADILAERPHLALPGNTTLFTGDAILSCAPITAADYRKFVYDRCKSAELTNFKNIWLQHAGPGRYDALIETWDGKDDAALSEAVAAQLRANRNLGETFDSVRIMQSCALEVAAVVTLARAATPEAVMADILFRLQDALVPFIQPGTVGQLMREGVAPDDIYIGPRLRTGVIPDNQFAPLPAAFSALDASSILLASAGVQAVDQVTVNGQASAAVAVPAGQVARLQPSIFEPNTAWPIRLIHQGQPVSVDPNRVRALLAERIAGTAHAATYAPRSAQAAAYTTLPTGEKRDIAHYYSIQRQFPITYGIGAYGVQLRPPQSAATAVQHTIRLAQAKQLKAYLLFFEQVLADGFAQLAGTACLFSLEEQAGQSYFWQPLVGDDDSSPPNLIEYDLLRAPPPRPQRDRRYEVQISAVGEDARVLLRGTVCDDESQARELAQRMLQAGADPAHYLAHALPNGQARLLLDDEHGQRLGFATERYASEQAAREDAPALAAFVAALAADPALSARHVQLVARGVFALRLVDDAGQACMSASEMTQQERERRIAQWLTLGIHADNYRIVAAGPAAWHLNLCDRHGATVGEGVQRFASEDEANAAIASLVTLFGQLCCDEAARERHLLLLPQPQPPEDGVASYLKGMRQLVHSFDPALKRRNRFLDHLLARFDEGLSDAALLALDPRPDLDHDHMLARLACAKRDFLREYAYPPATQPDPERAPLGAGRSTAGADAQPGSLSGLARRLRLLLAMPAGAPPPAHGLPWQYLQSSEQQLPAMTDALLAQPDTFVFSSAQPALMRALLRDGASRHAYQVSQAPDASHVSVQFAWPDGSAATEVLRAPDVDSARRAVGQLTEWLRDLACSPDALAAGEQLYVLEHVLLTTADTGSDPFYRFRISVILPDWPVRFQDPRLRALARQLVDENCPAHLAADLHWLDADAMASFTALYQAWTAERAQGAQAQAAQALAAFIQGLGAA
jgi:hypothetical protein